jgi:hypothetical protein
VVQITGTVLGIPVGLGSAYSIYRANFSVETVCQNLRSNILSMVDKKIDATTRRILVRRDVETFEKFCGIIDPDAELAFKRLLAAEKESPASPAGVENALPQEKTANVATPKPDPRPGAKKSGKNNASSETAPRDRAESDAHWLEAVRVALVHKPAGQHAARKPRENAEQSNASSAQAQGANVNPMAPADPWSFGTSPETATQPTALSPAPNAPPAPALPPPATVAAVPSQPADANHPVPPASVPETTGQSGAHGSTWISYIPFVGQILDR